MSRPLELHVTRYGSGGEPLVLIHGVGHLGLGWRPVSERLAGEFSVYACDSPGFGRSAPLPAGVAPTVPAYADAFATWLAAEGLERPHVAGNSMGGAIALELLRRDLVASATAFSPAGFWDAAELRRSQLLLRAMAPPPGPLRPLLRAAAGPALARRLLLAMMMAWPQRIPAGDARAALDALWASPVFLEAVAAFDGYRVERPDELDEHRITIAWGAHDRLLPFAPQSRRARVMLPAARHVTLGAGHLPQWDDPDAVAETIRRSVARAAA